VVARAAAADLPAEEAPEAEPEPEPEVPAPPPVWYPGNDPAPHLDAEMPGFYGFDPLSLGSDADLLKWFVQAELQHARWAMLGVVGILVPEALTMARALKVPVWTEAGASEYFTTPLVLFVTQLFVMGWAESRRWQDITSPGSVNSDPIFGEKYTCPGEDVGYPGGGWFNPLGMAMDEAAVKDLRTKEIKNGRLAMVSMVGFAAQSFITGKGPLDCLVSHIIDPYHTTFVQMMDAAYVGN